jgi:hypothetical protein
MPVKIINEKYQSIFRPLDNNITWVLGNVGVWQKLTLTCEFEVAINFSTTNALFMEEPNVFTLTDGSSWTENGFEVGDSIEVKWTVTNTSTGVSNVNTIPSGGGPPVLITEIDGSIMRTDTTTLGLGALQSNIYPAQFGDDKIHSVFIRADKQIQSIEFQPAMVTNFDADSGNLISFIDGTETRFIAEDTDLLTFGDVIPMTFLGNQSGMSIASCNLTYVAKQATKYIYEIDMVFMISSFFEDETTFEDNISPPQTFDASSLTMLYSVTGFTTTNNPNIQIQNDIKATKQLGNTGWFDENFNGLPNNFTLSSVQYFNSTGTQVTQLDYRNTVKVRAVIDGVANLTGATKCAYGFMWIPTEESDYKQLPDQFYKNTKVNTGGNAATFADVFPVTNVIDVTLRNGYSSDGAQMNTQNVRFQQTGATQITFEADFIPNAAFSTFMESRDETERNYILWVSVADQNDITNKSDRVSLKLDYNTLDTYIEPIGAFDGMNIGFLDHTQDETDTPSICGNDIRIEDDLLAKIEFQVDTAVSDTIPIPTGLKYGILLQRDSDGYTYELDSYSIDLTQYPDPSQYSFSASRGFKLGDGNNKNFVKAEYYPALDSGTKLGVLGLYGFKVRWEDWIARNNVPTDVRNVFYDASLKSNGLSNDWYRYLSVSGWSLHFYVYTDALLAGEQVRYVNQKNLVFQDYDANADVLTTFTYKRESDGSVLSGGTDPISGLPLGVILDNELVRLEVEYERLVGTWASVNDVYALNTIEVDEGAGQFEYRQLSSIWLPENDNPLLPLTGATLLDLVLVSPTVVRATCLIDPSKLIQANRYKITGREGCK